MSSYVLELAEFNKGAAELLGWFYLACDALLSRKGLPYKKDGNALRRF